MRAILEAGKARRRVEVEGAAEAEAASRRAARVLAEDGQRAEAAARPSAPPATVDSRARAPGPEPAASAGGEGEPGVVTIRTLASEVGPGPATGAALERTAVPPAVPPVRAPLPATPAPPPALPPALPPAAAPAERTAQTAPKLELLRMVEPAATPRLLDLLIRPDISVEFTIATDGSVRDIQVLPPAPRPWVPVITEALEQWRYAPVTAPHRHRVQLVFKPPQ